MYQAFPGRMLSVTEPIGNHSADGCRKGKAGKIHADAGTVPASWSRRGNGVPDGLENVLIRSKVYFGNIKSV